MATEGSGSGLGNEVVDLDASHLLSTNLIQELITKSIQAALAVNTTGSVSVPSTSGCPPTKGKAAQKLKHLSVHFDSPAGEVYNVPQAGSNPTCHTPHIPDHTRPLGPKETTKGHRSARRIKPDSYDTSEDESEMSDGAESSDSLIDDEEDAGRCGFT